MKNLLAIAELGANKYYKIHINSSDGMPTTGMAAAKAGGATKGGTTTARTSSIGNTAAARTSGIGSTTAARTSTMGLLRGASTRPSTMALGRGITPRGLMSARSTLALKPSIQQLDREKRSVERKISEFMRKDEKPKDKTADDEIRKRKRKPFAPEKKVHAYWVTEKAA